MLWICFSVLKIGSDQRVQLIWLSVGHQSGLDSPFWTGQPLNQPQITGTDYRQSNRWSSWPDWFLWFLMNRTVEMKILLFVFCLPFLFRSSNLFSLSHNRCPAHFFQPVLSPPHHPPPQNSRCPAHSKTVHKTPQTTPQSLPRSSFSPPQS